MSDSVSGKKFSGAKGLWVALAWGLMGLLQCTAGEAPVPAAEVYQRAATQFSEAWFLKPQDDKQEEVTFKLAPLFLEQATGEPTHTSGQSNRFGALQPGHTTSVDVTKPTVYFAPDTVQIRNKPHARITYLWFYPRGISGKSPEDPVVQGVRITLGTSGNPELWEVLMDSSGLRVMFVSQVVESAAAAEFGAPLAGRRHAVEAPAGREQATVARIIDDGPVPMGPILYVGTSTTMWQR